MAFLPTPGADDGTWGGILNTLLEVSLNADGTLNTTAVNTAMDVTGDVDITDGVSTFASTLLPSAGKYPLLHKTIAQVQSGSGSKKLLMVGDSVYLGIFADYGQGPIPYMVNALNAAGVPASFGLSGAPGTGFTDPRWSLGTGWTSQGAGSTNGWGGNGTGYFATGGASPLTYTPDFGTYDSFDIYYFTSIVTFQFKVNFNGGADTTVNADTGTTTVAKVTVTGSPTESPTCNIHSITGGAVILGVEPRLSTAKMLYVADVGVSGAGTTGWTVAGTSPGYGPLDCIKGYAPDLTMIGLGINDMNVPITSAQFISNLALIIAAAEVSGGVILTTQNPFITTTISTATQDAFWAALIAYAKAQGLPMIDVYNAWGTAADFAELNTLGYIGDAEVHPSSGVGQPDVGRVLATGMLSL